MINVILADDHNLVRDGIKSLLANEKDIKVIAEAENGEQAIDQVISLNPDMLIVDIRMPLKNGIEAIDSLRSNGYRTKCIVLSMHDSEEYVIDSIRVGADGYLLKGTSKEEFLKAIRKVNDGGKYFSGDISKIIIENIGNLAESKTITPYEKEDNPLITMTKREKEILKYVFDGKTNKEIADELDISKRTIEVHRFNLMKKLNVKNQMELAKAVRDYNLL